MRPPNSHQKLLELRNTFIKLVRYEIYTHKTVAFLFISDTTKEIRG